MPTTAHDAKGMLIASIEDDDPVVFLEHRWLYGIKDHVPEEMYRVPLGKAKVMHEGKDVTLVGISYMTLEALRARELLLKEGIEAEVIDLRSLKPWDEATVLSSVKKTGRLLVADTGWKTMGFGAEIVASVTEGLGSAYKSPPARIALPDCPTPTSPALSKHYYPRAPHIVSAVLKMFGRSDRRPQAEDLAHPLDVPDASFTGPF